MLTLSEYQIIEEISSSSKYILYRGLRRSDQQPVILKCLRSDYPTLAEIASLQQEYEIAHSLEIDGIVKPLAFLNTNNRPILVLSDFGGISLREYLTHRQLSLSEFLHMSIQIVHILGELHKHNIVHRDINPSNIIINSTTLEVKITDLSQASSLFTEQTTANAPILEGTLAYMSPEATGRINRTIDYRTDFYSLGVTFYEMLTKQLPHNCTDPIEFIHAHIAKIPIEPQVLNPQIPLVLSDLVMKLLAENPEDRYQSAIGIKSDLELCRTQLDQNGYITNFSLSKQDFTLKLQISPETSSITLNTASSGWENFDLTALTQAAQLISGEIELDELLKKLMRIMLENAGARAGCFILNQSDTLFIKARGTLAPDWIVTIESIPVETSAYLPISVINYVANSKETLVLNDASEEGDFLKDYHIIRHQSKSILCIPILGGVKLIGILYLENELIAGAFTPSRTKLLKVLSSQAAIALENSQLYERLKDYSKTLEQKLEETNQRLQQEILIREEIEVALRLSEEKFSRAFRSSPYPLSLSRFSDGILLEVNDSWLNIFEYSPSEVIGHSFADLNILVDLEESEKIQQMLQKQETVRNLETDFRTKSGKIKTFLFSAERIDIAGETYIIAVGNDITERKQAELALESAKQVADAANRAKSTFLANMSHELRTPLNAILGFSQLMSLGSNLSLEQQENLAIISRSGEHLLTLINQVLDLSKIEAGRITLNETNFDLHRLLQDLVDMFQLQAKNKGLQLLFELAPNVPRYVRTDEIKLRQVLLNLLSNAIKFTFEGGVSVRVGLGTLDDRRDACPTKLVTDHKENKGELTQFPITNYKSVIFFEIEDSGVGIATEELETIFEAFVQTKIGQSSPEGTGLGLTIARSFVQLMRGEITVNTRVEQGSIFKFTIKVNSIDATDIQRWRPPRRAIALAPNQPKYRILIVDDRWDNRQLLIKLLSPFDFELYQATNGIEAIEIWEETSPHLIFMDMRMPVMDGYEATKRIKTTTKGQATAVIALTASTFDEERAIIISTGCDDFIRKPFRDANIFDALHKHIGVVFVYEELSATTTLASPEPYILTKASFATLPSKLVANLQQAISDLDTELMQKIIAEIGSFNQPLANALANRVKKFQYEQLLNLIQTSTD